LLDQEEQFGKIDRLLEEMVRPGSHGGHGRFDFAIRRHHDHGERRVERLDARQQFESGSAGESQVEEHEIRGFARERREQALAVGNILGDKARFVEPLRQPEANEHLVVTDHDAGFFHSAASCDAAAAPLA
jgi:hypothetical protein